MKTESNLPDFGRSVFVCSKPLQALHCASIARHCGIRSAALHVLAENVDQVEQFNQFFQLTDHRRQFLSVDWHSDHRSAAAAFERTDYDSIFIEDDRVSNYQIYAPLKKRFLSVFEEGIGTYVGPIVQQVAGLRLLKWRLVALRSGCGLAYGGGRATDFVFVQSPAAYAKLRPRFAVKARWFPGLMSELDTCHASWQELVDQILPPTIDSDVPACLVLGTWGSTPSDFQQVNSISDRIMYFKPHPHDGHVEDIHEAILLKETWVPAEVLVEALAQRHSDLLVVHHASSVQFNLRERDARYTFLDVAAPELSALVQSVLTADKSRP